MRTFRDGPRVPWAIIAVLISTIGGVTTAYVTTRGNVADCATHGEVNALDKRLSDQGETIRTLTQTVGHNADQAHNDSEGVRTLVLSLTRE